MTLYPSRASKPLNLKHCVTVLALAVLSTAGLQSETDPDPDNGTRPTPNDTPIRIVAFGDSLTAGYNLSPDDAWPAVLQRMLKTDYPSVTVANAGISGDSSAGGKRRVNWTLRQPVDIFILALGANDALRGSSTEAAEANLQAIIDAVRTAHPKVHIVIAGMLAPPNLGRDYQEKFAAIFPRLAKANDATLIPFLLEGVAGDPELNLGDGIHPNTEGQKILAKTVAEVVRPVMEKPH
jgi:acyl-CoA thioesterase-1